MGFIAPLGRPLSFRYMFIGDVIMCRNFVVGRITRNAMNATTCTTHIHRCASLQRVERPRVDERRQRVADERPLLEAPAGSSSAMRTAFGEEPGDADDANVDEDRRVFGLGLDADAVRALDVAAHDRPADTDEEDDAGEVARRTRTPGTCGRAGTSVDSGSWWSISSSTVAMNKKMKPK